MSKVNPPSQKKQYAALNERLNKYSLLVQDVYDSLNKEGAAIALSTGHDGERPFSFSDYPETMQKVEELRTKFVSDLGQIVMRGTSTEWRNSNLVQDLLADKVLQAYDATKGGDKYSVYYQENNDALKAFQQRKDKGMRLSEKLWNQSAQYKEGLEEALSVAIEKGTSAVTLSKKLSQYLNDYPSLAKDYAAKYGKASNAGDCEYRSIRLARSEINMAYRKAEQLRWQQMDFVVGYEIKTSNTHSKIDICDTLAGKYPKDFDWTGWHPNDKCYKIPILKTEEEFFADDSQYSTSSVNEVTDVPFEFKKWIVDNQERIDKAIEKGTLPYFIKDNPSYVSHAVTSYPTLAKAEARHEARSNEEIERIQKIADSKKKLEEWGWSEYVEIIRKVAIEKGFDISYLEQTLIDNPELATNMMVEMMYKKNDRFARLIQAKIRQGRRSEETKKMIQRKADARKFDLFVQKQRSYIKRKISELQKSGYTTLSDYFVQTELDKFDSYTPEIMFQKAEELLGKILTAMKQNGYDKFYVTAGTYKDINALLNGGTLSKVKIRGVKVVHKVYQTDYVDVVRNTPSMSRLEAERRMKAMMPPSVTVDFGKTRYNNSAIIDGFRDAVYDNLNFAPNIANKISFIGTNVSQFTKAKDTVIDYLFNETKIFSKTVDPAERRSLIEKAFTDSRFCTAKEKELSAVVTRIMKEHSDLRYKMLLSGWNDPALQSQLNEIESRLEDAKGKFMTFKSIKSYNGKKLMDRSYVIKVGDNYQGDATWNWAYSDPWHNAIAKIYDRKASETYNPKLNGLCVNEGLEDTSFANSIKRNIMTKYHPQGTESMRSIFDHEFGHKLVEYFNLCNSSDIAINKELQSIIAKYKKKPGGIMESLSEYAKKNDNETVAEAWCEYLNSESPRPMAKEIGELIETLVGKKFVKNS